MKLYTIEADDFIVYRKVYHVQAKNAKEAKRLFHKGEYWAHTPVFDSGAPEDISFSHCVIRKVIQQEESN